ncbi:MAG: NifB/NifX family molybdenum-iron cluster-binding protein [Candidatus Thorarchaeota archaeon]
MTPRVLIPTDDQDGMIIAEHFGRAPYFAVLDVDDSGEIQTKDVHPSSGAHLGGRGHAHNNVLSFSPQVVIVSGMGPRGIQSFQEAMVAVLRADSSSVENVIASYNKGTLSELTEGCAEAHHK